MKKLPALKLESSGLLCVPSQERQGPGAVVLTKC